MRRLIDDGVTGEDVRGLIEQFVRRQFRREADGQVERAAARFGLISAAGELAARLGIVPWPAGAARDAAAWALDRWIELRGGTEPAEARQAVESVRLFIEQHGDARFASVDDPDARPVANRAGYRKGNGAEREWWVLPEVWRTEICAGQDAQFVARALAERGHAADAGRGLAMQRARQGRDPSGLRRDGGYFRGGGRCSADVMAELRAIMRGRACRNRAEQPEHPEH